MGDGDNSSLEFFACIDNQKPSTVVSILNARHENYCVVVNCRLLLNIRIYILSIVNVIGSLIFLLENQSMHVCIIVTYDNVISDPDSEEC